jgi:hypothetical protein
MGNIPGVYGLYGIDGGGGCVIFTTVGVTVGGVGVVVVVVVVVVGGVGVSIGDFTFSFVFDCVGGDCSPVPSSDMYF